MLWYRHWLELRWRWLVIVLLALFMAATLPSQIATGINEFNQTGKLVWALQPYQDLLQPMGAEPLFIWHEFAERAFSVMLFTSWIVLALDLVVATQPPDYFTLSLPVSRQRFLWTRFLLDWIAMGMAAAVMLAAAAILIQRPVPWDPLLLSCATAWLAMLPVVAAMKLVSVIAGSRPVAIAVGVVGLLPYTIGVVRMNHGSLGVVQDPSLLTMFGLWALLGTGIFGGMAILVANQREY